MSPDDDVDAAMWEAVHRASDLPGPDWSSLSRGLRGGDRAPLLGRSADDALLAQCSGTGSGLDESGLPRDAATGLVVIAPAPLDVTAPAAVTEGARPSAAPLSTWLAVAAALGVDDSTIRSHRRRTRDETGPFFASDVEARSWYSGMVNAPDFFEGTTRPRNRKPKGDTGNQGWIDWKKVKV